MEYVEKKKHENYQQSWPFRETFKLLIYESMDTDRETHKLNALQFTTKYPDGI